MCDAVNGENGRVELCSSAKVPSDSVMFAKEGCVIVKLFVVIVYWTHSRYEAEMLCSLRGKRRKWDKPIRE